VTLVLSVQFGADGAQFELETPQGSVLATLATMGPSTFIPPGSFVGQAVAWDGSAWSPLAPGDPLVVDTIAVDTGVNIFATVASQLSVGPGGIAAESDDVHLIGDTTLRFDAPTITATAAGPTTATLDATQATIATAGDATLQGAGDAKLQGTTSAHVSGGAVNITSTSGSCEIDAATVFDVEAGSEADINSAGSISLGASTSLSAGTPGGALFMDTTHITLTGASLGLASAGGLLGFYEAAPVVKQTITGVTTQDQVDSIVAALVALGLVIDGR